MIDENRRKHMIAMVNGYFEACNSASREEFAKYLTEDCRHWFPPGTGGPYNSRREIEDLWIGFVKRVDSRWTIDRMVCDGQEICVEWTHWKPGAGEHIRGSEWYEFAENGKINAIWAHYASPRDPEREANVLEGFDYAAEGYPLEPPVLPPAVQKRREESLAQEGQND